MGTLTVKHSDEAMAFLTLFKAMKPEIKKEVGDLITQEAAFGDDELSTDMITEASMNSFRQVWDAPEDEHWDDFIKRRLDV